MLEEPSRVYGELSELIGAFMEIKSIFSDYEKAKQFIEECRFISTDAQIPLSFEIKFAQAEFYFEWEIRPQKTRWAIILTQSRHILRV